MIMTSDHIFYTSLHTLLVFISKLGEVCNSSENICCKFKISALILISKRLIFVFQGCHSPWKSWNWQKKIPGPGKSLNLGCSPWKSWNGQNFSPANIIVIKMSCFFITGHNTFDVTMYSTKTKTETWFFPRRGSCKTRRWINIQNNKAFLV